MEDALPPLPLLSRMAPGLPSAPGVTQAVHVQLPVLVVLAELLPPLATMELGVRSVAIAQKMVRSGGPLQYHSIASVFYLRLYELSCSSYRSMVCCGNHAVWSRHCVEQ